MKRMALALTLIIVTLLAFIMGVAYYGSVNHPYQGENSLPTASPMPTSFPSPTTTPTPTSSPSSSLTTGASFDGLGVFGITSPSNKTYSSNTLTLSVAGQVIIGSNVYLTMNYSLDGQESLPLPVVVQTRDGSLVGSIVGSVTLPNLSDGSHNITVFGDLKANGPNLAQATVYFTVQGS